jgi:uncharacterized lipoprotein YmbA
MTMLEPRTALLLALALAAAGCGSSPKRNFYTLQAPPAPGTRTVVSEPGQPAVVVGPVTVPDTVDRSQIVVRTSDNRLDISDLNRWAEPLRLEIARVLAANLSRDLGGIQVSLQGQETAAREPDVRVAVDVLRFESVLGEAAIVEAAWVVLRNGAPPVRGRSSSRESIQGQGYEALAAAHSKAIAKIGRDIAAVIREGTAPQSTR